MSDQVALSNKSLINLSSDTPVSTIGSVSVVNSQISMGAESQAIFEYNYNTSGESSVDTQGLQLDLRVNSSDPSTNTRYTDIIKVILQIQYYNEETDSNGNLTDYVDGNIDQFLIIPYLDSESKGYINSYQIPVDNRYIKKISVIYTNNSNDSIVISEVSLRYTMTVSKAIYETVGFDISLVSVEWHPNGFRLVYDGAENDDRFYWNGNQQDELNGIDVNHVKLIAINNHLELLE